MGCSTAKKIEREVKRPFRKVDEEARRIFSDIDDEIGREIDFIKENAFRNPLDLLGGGDSGGEPSPAPTTIAPRPSPAPTNVYPSQKGKKKRGSRQRFGVAQRPEELGILRLAKGGKLGEVQNPVLYQSLFG